MENHERPQAGSTPLFQFIQNACDERGMSISELCRKLHEQGVSCDRSTLELWKKRMPKAIATLYAIQAVFAQTAIVPTASAGNHRRFHHETPAIE